MTKLEYTHADIAEVDADARLGERNRLAHALRIRLDEIEADPTYTSDPELNGYANGLRAAIHLATNVQPNID